MCNKWFSMESAPKDGAPFLARYRWLGEHRFMVIRWKDKWWLADGSGRVVGDQSGPRPDPIEFTHWQPLPSPPAEGGTS